MDVGEAPCALRSSLYSLEAVYRLYGDATRITVLLGWVTVPVVIYGFYQLISGGLGPLYMFMSGTSTDEALDTAGREFLTGRAYGFFTHPNTLGSFGAVMTAALLAIAGRTDNKATSAKCYALASVAFIGIVSSGSRGERSAALGAAIFVLLALSGKKGAIRIAVGIVVIIAVFAIANQFDLLPVSRETSIDEFTRESRLAVWGQALLLFLQHPPDRQRMVKLLQYWSLWRHSIWERESCAQLVFEHAR